MGKYYRIIDSSTLNIYSYFRVAFFRNTDLKQKVSLIRWIWLTFIEIIVGEELLESLVTTSSYGGCPEDPDEMSLYGLPQKLALHVPGGLINKLLMPHIVEVLYYKYHLQYYFLDRVSEPYIDDTKKTINVSRVRFRLKKHLLYQVISFRRVYITSWVVSNFVIDMLVYFFTQDIQWALLSALSIEALRRLVRI